MLATSGASTLPLSTATPRASSWASTPRTGPLSSSDTPQPLKGIPEVLAALRELGDPRYKLVVVGTARGEFGTRLRDQADETLRLLPDQPLARLPETLIAADLVCLLQDPASEVSRYQMPAKLTDALAMGIPVLATDVRRLPAWLTVA